MKHKLITILALTFLLFSYSQNRTISNMVNFKMENSGAIVNEENNIKGYYIFYEVDKINRKEREFAVNLIDQNLNELALKKFVATKNTLLIGSAFNNEYTMFTFLNTKEGKIILKTFDSSANQLEDIVLPYEKKLARTVRMMSLSGTLGKVLFPIKNKGFILNLSIGVLDDKLQFFPTNGTSKWEYYTPEDKKYVQSIIPLYSENDYMVMVESKIRGIKAQFNTVLININTGDKLFSIPYDENNPKLISNSFITPNDDIAILGQYYEPKAKIAKAQSLGLFVDVYNNQGDISFQNKMSWAKDINEKLPVINKSKFDKIGYIFFHDIIRTQSGDFYAIGEQYRKTVSAGGVASGILLGALGGVQTSGFTQLTIDDAFVFKFNENFELSEINIYDKGKSRVQNIFDFGSPQLNAFQIKAMGGFDYVYTQLDKSKDRFYANFIDYEREGEGKNRFAFKTIIYDEGELSEDKIYLPNKKTGIISRVLPGKLGHILILEYDKKEKRANLHLEKLNIK